MSSPRVHLIAAVAANGVIGANNTLPWRLPEDLKHFRALTLGHPVIMGRNTWVSLGKPLPGRRNMVVSRNSAFDAPGAETFTSLEAALAACHEADVFVIGGAVLYRDALPLAHQLHLTEIAQAFDGDTRFPDFDRAQWRETARETHTSEQGFDYAFITLQR